MKGMNNSLFVAVAILALALIALLVWRTGRHTGRRPSPLVGLSFVFFMAGLFFGSERLLGYALFGVGLLLAVADILLRRAQPHL